MDYLIAVYIFGIGAIFGSFALAVADREIAGRSWARGRSKCDGCGTVLRAIDLIPIFSWLIQRGKCRKCGTTLSVRYPLVELGLGIAFLLSYLTFNPRSTILMAQLVLWLLALVLLCVLFVIDARTYFLPYKFIFPVILLSSIYAFLEVKVTSLPISEAIINYTASLFVASGIFFLIYIFSKGKLIGDSDILIGIAIALFLGSPLKSWLVLFVASLSGLAFSFLFARLKRKKLKSSAKIPFGPFLIFGLFIVFNYGDGIISLYFNAI
jgi:prepilin signal peptidase PulO-like enzyme (type II secretory pathway)